MTLYIDADAFPILLKNLLLRAIDRLSLKTYVIANKNVNLGESKNINYIIVPHGADEADNKIVEMLEAGDLVITGDIPLADRIISKKAHAINHRGKLYTEKNIKESLGTRNFMQEMRDAGMPTKGAPAFNKKDIENFINQFNKFVTKRLCNGFN